MFFGFEKAGNPPKNFKIWNERVVPLIEKTKFTKQERGAQDHEGVAHQMEKGGGRLLRRHHRRPHLVKIKKHFVIHAVCVAIQGQTAWIISSNQRAKKCFQFCFQMLSGRFQFLNLQFRNCLQI